MYTRPALAAVLLLLSPTVATSALVSYNSASPDQDALARTNFYNAAGVAGPQFRVDFETGFTAGENIAGQTGRLRGGLVLRGSQGNNQAVIAQGPASIDLSNPVGAFAVTHTRTNFSGLILDFAASPVDYVAFQVIDTDSNNSLLSLHFIDGSTINFAPDSTFATGDSAEFLGFFRNDLPPIRDVEFLFSGLTYGIDNIEFGVVPSMSADFDHDSEVDAEDLALWQLNFGIADAPAGADYDLDVDGADFLTWQLQLGSAAASASSAVVPEPTAALSLTAMAAGLVLHRRNLVRREFMS